MKKMLFFMTLMLFAVFITSAGAVELNQDVADATLLSDTSYPPEDDTLPETGEEYPADQDMDTPDEVDEEPDYTDDEDIDHQDEDEEDN